MKTITKYLLFTVSLFSSLSAFEHYEAAAAADTFSNELEVDSSFFSITHKEDDVWIFPSPVTERVTSPSTATNSSMSAPMITDKEVDTWLKDKEKDVWLTETLTSSTSSAQEIENKDTPTKNKTRVHTCDYCQKSFPKNGTLIQHIRIHTGEKPYTCDTCGKCFALQGNLTIHIRTHTGEKPFQCNYCEKSFALQGHFKNHVRIHTGEKPYTCEHCEKSFAVSSNLNDHIRIHTGEKPFQCEHCEKCFSRQSNLKNHTKIHTGEKPFACDACGKCFTAKTNLTKHQQRTHIGQENNVFSLDLLAPDSHAEAATDLKQQQ